MNIYNRFSGNKQRLFLREEDMLLKEYTMRISRSECNTSSEAVYCIATFNEDISEVLPYLNTALHGSEYFNDPPTVMFRREGRSIRVDAHEIAVNQLADEEEADRVIKWWQDKINEVWEKRKSIVPSYEVKKKPRLIDVLRLLPKTNCKKCGHSTCMVFASQVVEGKCGATQCPELVSENREKLSLYLTGF